ncbi:MAG: prepilin-type N-terminal cleavage/methylation domain-containing protein [Pararhodobacter sp.]|nr:prepilin-type N-terminal cleavage/methylation domain-containing protein [Pararhodobacter sp.]
MTVARQTGFTLIELIAVLAIFALVSVMALQGLTGAIYQRSVLERVDNEAETLSRALTLLRRDLEAAIPVAFRPPLSDPEPALHTIEGSGRFALSIAGHPRLPGSPGAGAARVIWRHDPVAGTLVRQVWPVLEPARGTVIEPERVILSGITGLTLTPLGTWEERTTTNASLPAGLEVNLTSSQHGPLRVVVAR